MSAPATTQSSDSAYASDHGLVSAYHGGDERAATELVGRHIGAVGRYLFSLGASWDEVDDLVQETFFRAFRRLKSWRGEASFRSWLLVIAGNLLKDRFRSRKGRQVIPLEGYDIPDRADPDADLAAGEAEEQLRKGIASLPRLQREVFLLRVQQGSEYEEIALVLGTSAGAARVHYHHAVKRLKELIR